MKIVDAQWSITLAKVLENCADHEPDRFDAHSTLIDFAPAKAVLLVASNLIAGVYESTSPVKP